jgi:hypothetical protein
VLEERHFEEQFDEAVDELAVKTRDALSISRQALSALLEAEAFLLNAAGKVFGTPTDDRLCSLAMSVEDLECDIRKEIKRMERVV